MVYDRSGKFLDSWGEGSFSYRTHGMFISERDDVYIVDDGANSVSRYDRSGSLRQVIGPAGIRSDSGYTGRLHADVDSIVKGAPPYNRPTNLATSPTGDLYVSDGYGNARIHRFTAGGDLLSSWGEPGANPGEFHVPHSTWVHKSGKVYVADRENERIQIFQPDGTYLSEWVDVQRPQYLYIDDDDLVYVAELSWFPGQQSHRRGPRTEYEPARVSIYDLEGNVLLRWSDPDPSREGYFVAPHSIWVDREGSIYLAEVTHTVAVMRGQVGRDAHTLQKFARI
jgi:streptogramin lyase